jgi:hypothetical protein
VYRSSFASGLVLDNVQAWGCKLLVSKLLGIVKDSSTVRPESATADV